MAIDSRDHAAIVKTGRHEEDEHYRERRDTACKELFTVQS